MCKHSFLNLDVHLPVDIEGEFGKHHHHVFKMDSVIKWCEKCGTVEFTSGGRFANLIPQMASFNAEAGMPEVTVR